MDKFDALIESDQMREVRKHYNEAVVSLAPEARKIADAAVNLFNWASMAYSALNDKYGDPVNRIYGAGDFGYTFLVCFDSFTELTGLDEDGAIAKLESVSNYMEKHKWISLPVYEDIHGRNVMVTAKGMVSDMKQYHKSAQQLRATNAAMAQQEHKGGR